MLNTESGQALTEASPLVSVLVPCFNHARYIETCLDSLLLDGYQPLELILIDDGSSDDSFAIAQRWAAENEAKLQGGIRLSRQDNQGVVKTLNRLLRQARGDYFALLASDDYLLPNGIQARVNHLLQQPDRLAVFGDAIGIDEDGIKLADSMLTHQGASRTALRCDRTRALEIILRWVMPGPVYLARRQVLDQIGFYNEDFCFEDRDYYLRLLAVDALTYVDTAVAAYRVPRIKNPQRYQRNLADRERIERSLAPQFRGWARVALKARAQRQRLQIAGGNGWWQRIVGAAIQQLLKRLRRSNRNRSRRLLTRT